MANQNNYREHSFVGRFARDMFGFFFVIPARLFGAVVGTSARWIWFSPLWMKACLVFFMLIGVGGVTYWYSNRVTHFKQREIYNNWKEFTVAAQTADPIRLKEILEQIIQKEPTNELAKSRLKAIESGEGDPTDKDMLKLLMRIHLRRNSTTDAVREAKKVNAIDPTDWLALCVLAQDAIERKDHDAVDDYLSRINDPYASNNPEVASLLFSISLHKRVDRDASKLRAFVVSKVLPFLKNQNISTIQPIGRIQVLACYIETVIAAPEISLTDLLGFWSWCTTTTNFTLDEAIENKDIRTLQQLGHLHSAYTSMVLRFKQTRTITPAEAVVLGKEVDDRSQKIWEACRKLDPTNTDVYAGSAMVEIKLGNLARAEELIQQGRKYPITLSLLTVIVEYAKRTDRSRDILPELVKLSAQLPNNLQVWQLLADTAEASNRRDIAIEAIQKITALGNVSPVMKWAEARLWMESGKIAEAYQLLEQIPEFERSRYAPLARAYAHALVDLNKEVELTKFIQSVDDQAARTRDAELALAAPMGILDATPTLARMDKVAELADRVITRWPKSAMAVKVKADALSRSCELSTPYWEESRVRSALDVIQSYKSRQPDDLWSYSRAAWLRIMGQKQLALAWTESAILRNAEKAGQLNDENLAVLGAVYLARLQYDDAIRCLSESVRVARHPAGAYIHLALAYHGKGDTAQARLELQRAMTFPRTDREQDDYKKAAKLIQE